MSRYITLRVCVSFVPLCEIAEMGRVGTAAVFVCRPVGRAVIVTRVLGHLT